MGAGKDAREQKLNTRDRLHVRTIASDKEDGSPIVPSTASSGLLALRTQSKV